jgi:predicted nucleic acid-binding Zn ribbon protein
MIYTYCCERTGNHFDRVKSVSEHRSPDLCKCGSPGRRVFNTSRPIVDKTEPEFYHSFGKVIKNKAQRKEEMKKAGVIEVGNESPNTIHKEAEKQLKHKIDTRWESYL